MSRVHEALRRAERSASDSIAVGSPSDSDIRGGVAATALTQPLQNLLEQVKTVSYTPSEESLLIDPNNPHEAPTEEFQRCAPG